MNPPAGAPLTADRSPPGAPPSFASRPVASVQALEANLAEHLPGFEIRPGQRAMMQAVSDALSGGPDTLIEAGTGTGKTLAYLLPILASGKRAIISTATRQLQQQLLDHDLPLAMTATASEPSVAVLKGRRNYLCRQRADRQIGPFLTSGRPLPAVLMAVEQALRTSVDGDIAELAGVSEQDPVWPEVTSTAENCEGSGCAMAERCFVVRARRRALRADLVIVNHHVLLADHVLRERFEGAGLLAEADVIVLDEAHALEDVVCQLFGFSVSTGRVGSMRASLTAWVARERGGAPRDAALIEALQRAETDFATALSGLPDRAPVDARIRRVLAGSAQALIDALDAAADALSGQQLGAEADKLVESLAGLRYDLVCLLAPEAAIDAVEVVRWVQQRPRGTSLVGQPVEVGPILARTLLAQPAVRIFTSATLAIAGDFSHIRGRLGLSPETAALCLPGGFDYPRQCLLYVPRDLPAPFEPGRDDAVAEEIARLCMASAGGTFALFSSRRGMRDAHARLRHRLGMTALLQGEDSREVLLQRFVAEQPAVLFATMGFWQGVDLPGAVLRMVVIDKIPFPPPDDPLFAARSRSLEAQGVSSFHHLSLPQASTSLRQGFGRLIRSHRDFGVVALLDPRLVRRPYGRRLLAALPPAHRTWSFPAVAGFMGQRLDGVDWSA